MNPKNIQALLAELEKVQVVSIVTHKNPDGDAIGSSLAWAHYLTKRGLVAHVITPDDYPAFLHFLPGHDGVVQYVNNIGAARERIAASELIFCLDFNAINRIGDLGTLVAESDKPKILVDHHREPEDFAMLMFSDIAKASTAEIIYDIIVALGGQGSIDADIATCLYVGIMTDTGSFRFPATTADTHRTVADLVERGAVPHEIHEKVFDQNSLHRLRLLGYMLQEKLQVVPECSTAYISLSEQELKSHHFSPGDTEGFVNYALAMQGIKMAAFFRAKGETVRISFRSKGSFSVNDFARKHFAGGGHLNAAGGMSEEPLEAAVERFVSLLPEYDELRSSN